MALVSANKVVSFSEKHCGRRPWILICESSLASPNEWLFLPDPVPFLVRVAALSDRAQGTGYKVTGEVSESQQIDLSRQHHAVGTKLLLHLLKDCLVSFAQSRGDDLVELG